MLLYGHAVGYAIPLPFNPGFCGVNLFFVLSGFLITYRLLTVYSVDENIQFRKFYIRRAFRILPPAFVYLFCIFLLGVIGALPRWDHGILGAALFARNYVEVPPGFDSVSWFTGHFWSLAVEEHFYLLWPLALHLAGARRAKWVAISGIVICFTWRLANLHYGLTSGLRVPFYFRTDTRFDALLVGSLVGIAYSDDSIRSTLAKLLTKRDTTVIVVLYIWVLWRMFAAGDPKELFLIAALLAVTSLHPSSWLATLLSLRFVRWIGQISYSLYIWQELFLTHADIRPLGIFNTFPLKIAGCFVMASLSFYLLESPMIKLGYKLTRVKAAAIPLVEAAQA